MELSEVREREVTGSVCVVIKEGQNLFEGRNKKKKKEGKKEGNVRSKKSLLTSPCLISYVLT